MFVLHSLAPSPRARNRGVRRRCADCSPNALDSAALPAWPDQEPSIYSPRQPTQTRPSNRPSSPQPFPAASRQRARRTRRSRRPVTTVTLHCGATALSHTANGEAAAAAKSLPSFGLPVDSIYTTVTALAVVLGLFLLGAGLVRRGGKKSNGRLPEEVVSVLGRVPLAARQFAELIRVGNKLVLVSRYARRCGAAGRNHRPRRDRSDCRPLPTVVQAELDRRVRPGVPAIGRRNGTRRVPGERSATDGCPTGRGHRRFRRLSRRCIACINVARDLLMAAVTGSTLALLRRNGPLHRPTRLPPCCRRTSAVRRTGPAPRAWPRRCR